MGSCISRCNRKRKRQDQECPNLVQDKQVITTQAPISPISLSSTKQLLSLPQSPTSTSSSISSFSCGHEKLSTTSYAFTSSSSSSLCSVFKERSFSNEFLKSCVKENPHIIHNRVNSSSSSTLNKRARASANSSSDFALTRQQSFRREIEKQRSPHSLTKSCLRSPSPTRRFSNITSRESSCKRPLMDKPIVAKPNSLLVKRENLNLRASSPRHNLTRDGPYLMTRERCSYNKIEDFVKVEVLACKQDGGDKTLMEDIDNPLIALDCFIFL